MAEPLTPLLQEPEPGGRRGMHGSGRWLPHQPAAADGIAEAEGGLPLFHPRPAALDGSDLPGELLAGYRGGERRHQAPPL